MIDADSLSAAQLAAALVSGLIVVAAWVTRPRPVRTIADLKDANGAPPIVRSSVIDRIGYRLLRIAGRTGSPHRARQVGAVAIFGPVAAVLDPRLGVLAVAASIAVPISQSRRAVVTRHEQVLQELPEVIDLLTVAVAGGLNVPLAVGAVARRVPGQVAVAFERCRDRAALGRRLADELDLIPDELGDATRPLVRALVSAERYGTPIVDALARVSADVRIERRRSAEIIARRLPIKLLFPLVACVLPAFVLLTVVPVLAGSLESIRS